MNQGNQNSTLLKKPKQQKKEIMEELKNKKHM